MSKSDAKQDEKQTIFNFNLQVTQEPGTKCHKTNNVSFGTCFSIPSDFQHTEGGMKHFREHLYNAGQSLALSINTLDPDVTKNAKIGKSPSQKST